MKVTIVLFFIAVVTIASCYPVIPYTYPLYKQCDPEWANQIMETTTICEVGCLMSSTSMAMGGKGITIDTNTSNPSTFNYWLRNNNGYTSNDELIESVVPDINNQLIEWDGSKLNGTALSMTDIQNILDETNNILILNVRNGTHFVLATGYDTTLQDVIYVNDPGFDQDFYYYDTVVGYRFFTMYPANSSQ
ncbi:hypothetical protein DLAC_07544 [Tieghemostelium lacteum]|uniref:Peptidase C39-like domain-containing protein n=1 Tax=Tieghemostelium lacteum TaxID=361077 RepID=A0A151ZCS8_TIELA|nr:hypothetical protein DLAC_07544 [Tieghemostelium lacteum]|eukprot:KYQ91756.1 hypothetical protein DLAC_07544 [Tieghemostelium lacteum]